MVMRPQTSAATLALPLFGSSYSPARLRRRGRDPELPPCLAPCAGLCLHRFDLVRGHVGVKGRNVILGWIAHVLPNKFNAKLLARRKLNCPYYPQKTLLRRDAERRVIEIKERVVAIPNSGMVVRSQDAPFAT